MASIRSPISVLYAVESVAVKSQERKEQKPIRETRRCTNGFTTTAHTSNSVRKKE
jgi:hypothetical protein